MRTLPIFAILLGIAGLLPFVLCGLGALTFHDDNATKSLLALSAYGAVILAFLGGIHWGVALEAGPNQAVITQRARFGLGVVPSLIGWTGLIATFLGWPMLGLIILTAGFISVTIAEARATQASLLPKPYMALRWVLSVGVILCLVSVLLVIALGGRIII